MSYIFTVGGIEEVYIQRTLEASREDLIQRTLEDLVRGRMVLS